MESFLLDTSALVKYYHPEAGSQWVLDLVRREQTRLLVSNLTVVEMHSALAKKYRAGLSLSRHTRRLWTNWRGTLTKGGLPWWN